MDWQEFFQLIYQWLITTGARIVFILFLTLIVLFLARRIVDRVLKIVLKGKWTEETRKRTETLASVTRNFFYVAIILMAVIMVLGAVGLNIGPVLAGAGVLGLAIGFGSQNLVQDVISGFFILLEDQIRVGDAVEIAGKAGTVEHVNLRTVVIRSENGTVHYIRNNQIDIVSNMSKDFSYYVFEIGISYMANFDEAIAVLKDIGKLLLNDPDFKADMLGEMEIMGLDRFGDTAVMIKGRIKALPGKQWRIGREFMRRVKMAFDEKAIEIPFTQKTIQVSKAQQAEENTQVSN